MFNDPDTEFVLVGAAHLVGADGLVELLRAGAMTSPSCNRLTLFQTLKQKAERFARPAL